MMDQKLIHLETGDYLDYAFEKADQLDDPDVRQKEKQKIIREMRECAKQYHQK